MSDYFLGEIRNFAFGRIPTGWLPCTGQVLNISQYQALFALLGTQFGGNGTSTFGLPDLRGRVPLGAAASLPQGTRGGTEAVTLTAANLPAHTHGMFANSTSSSNVATDISNFLSANAAGGAAVFSVYAAATAGPAAPLAPTSVTLNGSSGPHENRQPTLTTNFCISTQGIFPTRS